MVTNVTTKILKPKKLKKSKIKITKIYRKKFTEKFYIKNFTKKINYKNLHFILIFYTKSAKITLKIKKNTIFLYFFTFYLPLRCDWYFFAYAILYLRYFVFVW